MSGQDQPQIYLITPPSFELAGFSNDLSALLDGFEIACLRLRTTSDDATEIGHTADCLREIAHARDVPIVIENHARLAAVHGLDGVHLTDGARQIRESRKALAEDSIVGCFCETSRHSGMNAGEAGADYISFGPVTDTGLAATEPVELATFAWWSEMVELPVVAEGGITLEAAEDLSPVVDFLALGAEIWGHADGPKAALQAYLDRL